MNKFWQFIIGTNVIGFKVLITCATLWTLIMMGAVKNILSAITVILTALIYVGNAVYIEVHRT